MPVLLIATVATSVVAKLSIFHQVRLNHARKTTVGSSTKFFTAGAVSYGLYVAYGMYGGGWWLVVAQAPGAILSAVTVLQYFRYDFGRTDA